MSKETKKTAVPRLRFPEFQRFGEWDFVGGDKLFAPITNKNHSSDLPILAITQEHGAIPRDMIDYTVIATDKSVQSYKIVEIGDFIISLRSFQGGIEYSRYKGICSPAYIILRSKEDIDSHFYRHYFKSVQFIKDLNKNIEGIRDGKMVSYDQFSKIRIPFPKKAEQQKIADCLSSLEDLITAQNDKVTALKNYKKGLLQQLFPQDRETVPRLRFPEFRKDREWETRPFAEYVIKSFYGTSKSTAEKGRYPVLRMGNMVDGGLDLSNLVYIDLDQDEYESFRLESGDILLNRTNSLDLVGKISLFALESECITASYIVSYRLNSERLNPSFCNFMLNTQMYQAKIKAFARPSVSQANINPTTFREELRVTIPALAEQQRIADCLSALNAQIAAQSEKLSALRDHKKGLLQQLFPSLRESGW